MSGTIICTVDDSEGVEAAVQVARQLAERFDSRMVLVSVDGGRSVAEPELRQVEHRVAAGNPAEAVATIAAEEAADLIVVGSQRGLLGHMLRSSLAGELAATTSCPVVVALPG